MKHTKTAAAKTLLLNLSSGRWATKPVTTGLCGFGCLKLHYHCIFIFLCDTLQYADYWYN